MLLKESNRAHYLIRVVRSAVLIGILCLLTPISAPGAEIEDVLFDDLKKVDRQDFQLRGLGLMRYMVFFKVSVAGLYMPKEIPSNQVLSDVPKLLDLYYFHSITAKDFIEMTETWMAKNVAPEIIEKLRPRIDRYNNLFLDVVPKDRYRLTYLPGKGTELALNGKVIGRIEGADFASALYSIWLGPAPVSKSAKKGLLGDQ